MEKINILFLGYVVNKNNASDYSGISIAGNNMQYELVKKLGKNEHINLKIITVPPVAAFPQEKKLVFKNETKMIIEDVFSIEIGFANIPLIKQKQQALNVYKHAKEIIKANPATVIFTYNFFPQIGEAAVKLKKKYGSKIITLLADPPIDITKRNMFEAFFRQKFYNKTQRLIYKADGLVVLNKELVQKYAPGTPYVVVDGAVVPYDYKKPAIRNITEEKRIVFSGALTEYNGIIEAVKAMELITNHNIKLYIYGNGPLKKYVVKNQSENVKYAGVVDNEEMRKIQAEAFLLLNPRKVDDPMSMLTFPSKILEYMISGTPVLTTKLNGFSSSYLDKMFFIDNNTPQVIADAVSKIAVLPYKELEEMANKAKSFVSTQKNWTVQSDKIVDFIENIIT